MSDALQELDGVGPARADELADAGFDTIAAVAAASAEMIADETSISEGTAESLVADAEDLAGEETVDTEVDDVEATTEAVDDDGGDETEDEPAPEVRVDLTDDEEVAMHILHVVLEEATSQMQSSNAVMQDNAYGVANQLIGQLSGDENTYRVSCTQGEMNALYRALSQGEQDYASRAGIPGMYGTFRTINERVNDARTDF